LPSPPRSTLEDDYPGCALDVFGGEGYCVPLPHFVEKPGPDGKFCPLTAKEAHSAGGTSNLHTTACLCRRSHAATKCRKPRKASRQRHPTVTHWQISTVTVAP
jgi:hypothetical protein